MTESPWSRENPDLQIAWDSTSMTRLMECPRKYQLSILKGHVTAKAKVELEFGILFHKAMEFYHSRRAGRRPDDDAQRQKDVRDTFRFLLRHAHNLPEDPKGFRTPFTLLRAFLWYADKWKQDYLETYVLPNGKAATELSFRVALPLVSPDGDPYLYCGHIDRATLLDDSILVNDHKTTSGQLNDHWLAPFKTSFQITGYIFASGTVLPEPSRKAIIDGVQLAIGFHRFTRQIVERTPEQLDEWLHDLLYWIRQAEEYAESHYWPMNRASCGNYGGCPFLSVCGMDPKVRGAMLSGDFVVSKWNPLESR